jgi:hypothetical protein
MMSFGMILGILYGITLKLTMGAFNTASFILYGNPYTIPVWSAIIISSTAYVALITSEWWGPAIEKLVIAMFTFDERDRN